MRIVQCLFVAHSVASSPSTSWFIHRMLNVVFLVSFEKSTHANEIKMTVWSDSVLDCRLRASDPLFFFFISFLFAEYVAARGSIDVWRNVCDVTASKRQREYTGRMIYSLIECTQSQSQSSQCYFSIVFLSTLRPYRRCVWDCRIQADECEWTGCQKESDFAVMTIPCADDGHQPNRNWIDRSRPSRTANKQNKTHNFRLVLPGVSSFFARCIIVQKCASSSHSDTRHSTI